MEEYITGDLFKYCKQAKTKISKKVYDNVLNYDLLEVVCIDNETFYIQGTCSYTRIPNYAFDFVKKFYEKQGLKYLWDL